MNRIDTINEKLASDDDVEFSFDPALFTADAQALYRGLGFAALSRPERGMEILRPDGYRASATHASP